MWNNDTTLRLIELYKNYRCLWDSTHDGYKNKVWKNDSWEEMASIMQMPCREVEMKVHGLRSQFIRERKKIKRLKEMGRPNKSTWFAYEALSFLVKTENNRFARDTATQSDSLQDSLSNDSEFDNNHLNSTAVPEIDEHTESRTITPTIDTRKTDDLLRTIYRPPAEFKKPADEFEVYGQYVASELRNVKSEHAVIMAKYHINDIIFKARMGKYDGNVDCGGNHGPSSQDSMDPLRRPNTHVVKSSTATSMDARDVSNLAAVIKYESDAENC